MNKYDVAKTFLELLDVQAEVHNYIAKFGPPIPDELSKKLDNAHEAHQKYKRDHPEEYQSGA